ncbi:hypothetical protein fHeYen901_84 [Yersinia phage fHe-Yen9-01]|uniref:Uncharacterized protein n=1 Tax=Yersinia phage fHe-Yen9-01 TaxID=1965363 RepID=A0A1V0DXI3_9CAUD|nr:hypothetical protein KNT60_gp083 [Yersinia phage fHe-Yen9-01]ARB05857.1 hypothetical protein fHeYen901_84 [Yersinia phage fHe-Yen9-01]
MNQIIPFIADVFYNYICAFGEEFPSLYIFVMVA